MLPPANSVLGGVFFDSFDDDVIAPWVVSDGTPAESGGDLSGSDFTIHTDPSGSIDVGTDPHPELVIEANVTRPAGGAGFFF